MAARDSKDNTASVLDALTFGLFICDPTSAVVFANRAAEELTRTRAITCPEPGRQLCVGSGGESRRLQALVSQAATGGAGGAMQITNPDGNAVLVAVVTSLPQPDGEFGGRAVVALRPVRDTPAFTEDMLVALYGLSASQAAIALMLYNGVSAEEIAAARGVKISTIRSHISAIYLRTGAGNQPDLVRLLASLPPLR